MNASFPDRKFGWSVRSPSLTNAQVTEIEMAIQEFKMSVKELEDSPGFLTAKKSCMASRIAAGKLYLCWRDFATASSASKSIEEFETSLRIACEIFPTIKSPGSENELLAAYTMSMQRRQRILLALKNGSFDELHKVLIDSYRSTSDYAAFNNE